MLRKLRFFRLFFQAKFFGRWRATVRRIHYERVRAEVARRLYHVRLDREP
jgi:hypothetical protein